MLKLQVINTIEAVNIKNINITVANCSLIHIRLNYAQCIIAKINHTTIKIEFNWNLSHYQFLLIYNVHKIIFYYQVIIQVRQQLGNIHHLARLQIFEASFKTMWYFLQIFNMFLYVFMQILLIVIFLLRNQFFGLFSGLCICSICYFACYHVKYLVFFASCVFFDQYFTLNLLEVVTRGLKYVVYEHVLVDYVKVFFDEQVLFIAVFQIFEVVGGDEFKVQLLVHFEFIVVQNVHSEEVHAEYLIVLGEDSVVPFCFVSGQVAYQFELFIFKFEELVVQNSENRLILNQNPFRTAFFVKKRLHNLQLKSYFVIHCFQEENAL
ncbi:Hypothetical_protein [Hexamita inflata]|uniref:Hypothetical_protein n=1 Tax=Hexamita inflata TaxID=28002 RepID=A0AA86NCZ9_9EUKA|nr:Hypothetical protein HINF_LOCUS5172 [Hexamita inflata]